MMALVDGTNVFYAHLMLRLRAGRSKKALEGYLSLFNFVRRIGSAGYWLKISTCIKLLSRMWIDYSFVQVACLCLTACAIWDIHPGKGDMPSKHRSYITSAIN